MYNSTTYKNKKVFLTGHSGFKGAWLTLWLTHMGADVLGYSLPPETQTAMYNVVALGKYCRSEFGSILDSERLNGVMQDFKPDMVFHLAAQPLVRRSYSEPVLTYQTNVIGSLNVLEAARKSTGVKAFVNVTTDKCYDNREQLSGYKESDPMGGYDMYSSSKGCVEIMSASYRHSFLSEGFALATARAGNVIGGGDWAEDRLIPDCIRSLTSGRPIEIRNPQAVRPWQHVLEPLSGYLLLGAKLLEDGAKYADGFNFGPNEASVRSVAEIAAYIIECYGTGEVVVNKKDNLHEAKFLMLNIEKAEKVLSWRPVFTVKEAVAETVKWYKAQYYNQDMYALTMEQIINYEKITNVKQP